MTEQIWWRLRRHLPYWVIYWKYLLHAFKICFSLKWAKGDCFLNVQKVSSNYQNCFLRSMSSAPSVQFKMLGKNKWLLANGVHYKLSKSLRVGVCLDLRLMCCEGSEIRSFLIPNVACVKAKGDSSWQLWEYRDLSNLSLHQTGRKLAEPRAFTVVCRDAIQLLAT